MRYCTLVDVKNIAKIFSTDYTYPKPEEDEEINQAIDQATEEAKELLKSRYDISIIESDLPPIIKRFTANRAAELLIGRWQVSSDKKKSDIKWLTNITQMYTQLIVNGNLLSETNVLVSSNPVSVSTVFSSTEAIRSILNASRV